VSRQFDVPSSLSLGTKLNHNRTPDTSRLSFLTPVRTCELGDQCTCVEPLIVAGLAPVPQRLDGLADASLGQDSIVPVSRTLKYPANETSYHGNAGVSDRLG
jgi:hypothetical protein